MIINFFRGYSDDRKRTQPLLKTLNLDIIPRIGESVVINNQKFHIQDVMLDADKVEYKVYVVRA